MSSNSPLIKTSFTEGTMDDNQTDPQNDNDIRQSIF